MPPRNKAVSSRESPKGSTKNNSPNGISKNRKEKSKKLPGSSDEEEELSNKMKRASVTKKDQIRSKGEEEDEISDKEEENVDKQEEEEMKDEKPPVVKGRVTRSVATALHGPNYLFYTNQIPSTPSGDFIEKIHANWYGSWGKLEDHHGYIQWLFPVFESGGMNSRSEALTRAEAKLIRENLQCAKRVIMSYRLMLNFYGLVLVDEQTGEIARDKGIYKDRYMNLSTNSHNFLRISRIIISLGELGFGRYKKPLVDHFVKEVGSGLLKKCKRSLDNFWLPLLDETSAAYIKKTKENPEDRAESVFFQTAQ